MALTRRRFVETIGAVSGGSLIGGGALTAVNGAWPAFAEDPSGVSDIIKLDQNENPNPPGPSVTKAVMEAFTQGHRYPQAGADLVKAIAKLHGVAPENVLTGLGSGELLQSAIPAFVAPGRPLVAGLPTFEACTRTAQSLGLPVREVPVDAKLRLDLPAMEDAAGGAGLVFFCNPNNPTGTTWPTRQIEEMIDRLGQRSPETITLVDEAYAHFVESQGYYSLVTRAARDRRILVTRTFSKVYGLAGMRIGYAIGHKDTIAALKLTTTSGRLPVTTVAAALAVINDESLIKEQARLNAESRAAITRSLRDHGYNVYPSDTNFILVDVGQKPAEFQAACLKRKVIVGRPFPGLPTQARISVGSLDEMQRAAAIFKQILPKKA